MKIWLPSQNALIRVSLLYPFYFAAPSLTILESSDGHVYTVGTFFTLTCTFLNTSLPVATSTMSPNPWIMTSNRVPVSRTILTWTKDMKHFSTRNRKRWEQLKSKLWRFHEYFPEYQHSIQGSLWCQSSPSPAPWCWTLVTTPAPWATPPCQTQWVYQYSLGIRYNSSGLDTPLIHT